MTQIQFNSVGTPLTLEVYRGDGATLETDLVSAGTLEMYLFPPSGAANIKTKIADDVSPSTTGQMRYLTVDGDIDEVGTWYIQGHVVIGTGDWPTTVKTFTVKPNVSQLDPST